MCLARMVPPTRQYLPPFDGRHSASVFVVHPPVAGGERAPADFGGFQRVECAPGRTPPAPPRFHNRLLIVRLDDIGDYLLFRNQLGAYRESERWKDHTITLLGQCGLERNLRCPWTARTSMMVIWVNKRDYLLDANYRLGIWTRLRAGGFATVIAPSRTRPLLLDDLCVSAGGPGAVHWIHQFLRACRLESHVRPNVSATVPTPPIHS